jgi:hypothetical protein
MLRSYTCSFKVKIWTVLLLLTPHVATAAAATAITLAVHHCSYYRDRLCTSAIAWQLSSSADSSTSQQQLARAHSLFLVLSDEL